MIRMPVALACCLFLVASCGGDEGKTGGSSGKEGVSGSATSDENVVSVKATEYQFEMEDTITGGVVTLAAENTGGLPHEFAFGRIEGNHDLNDVMKAIQSRKQPKWFMDIAGIPVLSPGVSTSMIRELDEGRYIFLYFLPTPEGQPHVTEGMVHVFDVEGESDAEVPSADATITATDKGFEITGEIAEGQNLIELVNEGKKGHEFLITSPEKGTKPKDVDKWFGSGFKGDPPAVFPGGMQSIEPGTSVTVEMTFEAGRTYRLEDFEAGFVEEITVD